MTNTRSNQHGIRALVIVLALATLTPRLALALNACTAAQISSQDSSCPTGTGPCSITKNFTIANGCVLNFGTRAVTVTSSGTLDINSGFVSISAGSLTVAAGGFIDGRGTTAAPNDRGGSLLIQTTGNFAIQKATASGRVEVSGDIAGGLILLNIGGSINVAGKLLADGLTVAGEGGSLLVSAGGDIILTSTAEVSVAGGNESVGGGVLDMEAGGRIDLGVTVNAGGSDGGIVEITAGTDAVVRKIDAEATGDSGDGGCVNVIGGTNVQALGDLLVSGSASTTESGGGDGGFICLEARFGHVTTVSGVDIEARGQFPEGGGGALLVLARGNITIASGSTMSTRGNGTESCGGEICLEAELDLTVAGAVDGSGGGGGGDVDVGARRNVTLSGSVDATGRNPGGLGGSATVEAGRVGRGNLTLSGTLNASGGDCGVEMGCGLGGFTDAAGCDVTLTSTGRLLARGADAGDNCLRAREQLRIQGTVDATRTSPSGTDGSNSVTYKSSKPPIISGTMLPSRTLLALPTCATIAQEGCMMPCPTCGNGVVEFPETCDNSSGTPLSCDGCSASCQLENCNDGNSCTVDSCSTTLGCRNLAPPAGCTPAPTATATRTSTVTPTRTPTATRTRTPTVTSTSTAATQTRTPTATNTPTGGTPTSSVPLCSGGVAISGPFIKLSRLDATSGNEKMLIKGTFAFPPNVPSTFDPATLGAQLRVEDLGSGNAAIFDLTAQTRPIPPGPPGSMCANNTDGWKTNQPRTKQIYKNRSGALPPSCTAGSANGFSLLKLKDRRDTFGGIQIRAKAKDATIPRPVGPLRLTLVLGATSAAGTAGECGTASFAPASCNYSGSGSTLICR